MAISPWRNHFHDPTEVCYEKLLIELFSITGLGGLYADREEAIAFANYASNRRERKILGLKARARLLKGHTQQRVSRRRVSVNSHN